VFLHDVLRQVYKRLSHENSSIVQEADIAHEMQGDEIANV